MEYGKNAKPVGIVPAVALINPKYPHNVGGVIRSASCYGIGQVWYTGDRVTHPDAVEASKEFRLPREERMKGYKDVDLYQLDYFFDAFPLGTVPVAVEVRKNSELLTDFEHPENALYVFGPEDGSIPQVMLRHCHRFVVIPTKHCLNLSLAVGTVLYDRLSKSGEASYDYMDEERGFVDVEREAV